MNDEQIEHRPRLTPNDRGELAECGPQWACKEFGRFGHNYHDCPACHGNYQIWLKTPRRPREVEA